ncbi:MAG: hypothetical protein LBL43_05935 [Treponema sp.]|jgi:hypothetical protein|nr:hypothetical protein [Treponema sp.]
MKPLLPVVLVSALCALSCGAGSAPPEAPEEIIEYRLPDSERLYIYRGGIVVNDAVVPAEGIIDNTFILPLTIQPDSLAISQAGKRIYSYSTKLGVVPVMPESGAAPDGERPRRMRVLQVRVPDLAPGVPIEVKYGVKDPGLSWDFILDMEVGEQNFLECVLAAAIETDPALHGAMESILAQGPEIILASSRNLLLEDTGALFNLGKPVIEADWRMLIKLDEGRTPYRLVHHWDANRRERPAVYLRAPIPFKTMAEGVQPYLNSSSLSIASLSSIRISPDRDFDFYIGEQPNLLTYKSVTTAEYPGRENLPFTHSLEYRVANQLNRRVSVEISVPVAYGVRHRTVYHFTKAPDERPGDQMVWKYDLAPEEQAKVEFSFDSESKDNPLYSQFNYSDGGR